MSTMGLGWFLWQICLITKLELKMYTYASSYYGSDNNTDNDKDDDDSINHENSGDEDSFTQNSLLDKQVSSAASAGENFRCGSDTECSSTLGASPTALEMIMFKDVKIGAEVFQMILLEREFCLLHRAFGKEF
ncbi:uncharacterized protein LOC110808609 [Carica papaya]|uniref:uncharacterized protein LOC110808609 n=1 Tax=Carica papaya TaxID=3649 RepID=UPI000B8D0919|nr:uncharacterized protein LOC110808609 [Carica papaya]